MMEKETNDSWGTGRRFGKFEAWSLRDHSYTPDADSAALSRDIRSGRFPQNFADHEISTGVAAMLGIDRPYLEALGADILNALSVQGSYPKARAKLQRVLRRLSKSAWQNINTDASEYYTHWICSIQHELWRREDRATQAGRPARIFGIVVGAVEHLRGMGITPLADDLRQITRHFAGASSGETERAIHFHTRVVPLADWLLLDTKASSAERAP